MELRTYQTKAITSLRTFFAKGGLHAILGAATGSGKTVIFTFLSKLVTEKKKKVLILTDRAELLQQAGGSLARIGLKASYIIAGSKIVNSSFNCYVAMSQTLRRRINLEYWVKFLQGIDLLIIDECFIADTKIDNTPIENLKVGDYVNSFNHKKNIVEKKKIISTFKKKHDNNLIKVNLSCGSFVCTQKHPIFVIGKGYIDAKDLKNEDRVIALQDMWGETKKRCIQSKQLVRQNKKIQKKWIHFLQRKMQGIFFCKNAFRKDEKEQPDAFRVKQTKDVKHPKKNRSQTENTGREWQGYDSKSKDAIREVRGWVASRINYYNWKWIFAISLQNRHRPSIEKNSCRSRWIFSLLFDGKKKRQTENNILRIERIQSIEIYKRRNSGGFNKCRKDNKYNYVYNIEVEDNNNYFANNVLVHNCHKQEFNYIFESRIFDKKHVIGFTATPKRSGKMRQLAFDYETIIETVSVKELIKQEFLVNDDYYGFGSPDLSDVEFDHKKGDYKDSSLFKKFNSPQTYSGAIKAYKLHTPESKAICFCVNIEHCINTAIEFNKNGIDAMFVVSGLSKPKEPEENDAGKMARYEERKRVYDLLQENKHLSGDRKTIFSDFKNNKFKVLINAGIATTGYDEPSLETVIVLRATLSTTLWLQMLGRGSRIFDIKTHFNILDFGGNADRLGHYTEDRLWSLWHETFEGNGLPPIKDCGIDSDGRPISDKAGCKRPILAAYKICPFCGFKYPEKKQKEVDLELIMFDLIHKKSVKTKRLKDMSFQELHDYRAAKGHKSPWLWRQLWYRGGEDCIKEFGSQFDWSNITVEKAINYMR